MDPFQENIKDFVLNDRERFTIATSIYESFGEILDYMLKDVLLGLIETAGTKLKLNLQLREFGRQTNKYYVKINLTEEYHIHMESSYYFKTYVIYLRGSEQGYNPNNSRHLELRNLLKTDNGLKNIYIENDWTIGGIRNQTSELDTGRSPIDLYRVYKNEDALRDRLFSRFTEIIGPILIKLHALIN